MIMMILKMKNMRMRMDWLCNDDELIMRVILMSMMLMSVMMMSVMMMSVMMMSVIMRLILKMSNMRMAWPGTIDHDH